MNGGNRRLAQKVIAIVVIVGLLDLVGVSPPIMIFFIGAGFLIWRAAQRSENREIERIFDFYISADEILRGHERHWYGFEIEEVIKKGEYVYNSIPDPPPLVCFALGALYHSAGNHQATIQHLGPILEDEASRERHCSAPSSQLRRYVEAFRKIEREPAIAPQVLAAIRNLERGRQKNAAALLDESRQRLKLPDQSKEGSFKSSASASGAEVGGFNSPFGSLNPILAPPPICEVLHDVYQDDKTT